MKLFKKYAEIQLIDRVTDIMREPEVIVTEKLHGINVRIGWVDGRFRIGSRNEEFNYAGSSPNSSSGFMGWVRGSGLAEKLEELAGSIQSEVIFYGEWFGPGVQGKCIPYCREKQLRVFDVRIDEEFIDWDRVVELAGRIGLKTVPLLYRGRPDQAVFDELRDAPSTVARENGVGSVEDVGEGIVIKPTIMHRNYSGGDWVIAKYKSPKFSERKSLAEGKAALVTPASAIEFVEEFFTAVRLEHVLSNLVMAGVDIFSRTAVGQIIKVMYDDVIKESGPELDQLDEDSREAVDKIHGRKTKSLLDGALADWKLVVI
ncbi:MAG: RNA ligase family protein [Candidatus Buchananbacteria bacterium]|jgi:hypothetical protein